PSSPTVIACGCRRTFQPARWALDSVRHRRIFDSPRAVTRVTDLRGGIVNALCPQETLSGSWMSRAYGRRAVPGSSTGSGARARQRGQPGLRRAAPTLAVAGTGEGSDLSRLRGARADRRGDGGRSHHATAQA